MTPKKIVLVTLDYPPETGGVARYLGNLVHVADGSIEVFVNQEHETSGPGLVQARSFFWPIWPRWLPLIPFFLMLDRQRYQMSLISHVLPIGTAAWIASWFGRGPYTILLHGLDLSLAHVSHRRRWLMKRILHRARAVFVNSSFVAEEAKRFHPSLQPIIVTPGVETMSFPTASLARKQKKIDDKDFILLCVARLVPRKGIDTLISLLSDLPPHVRLVVLGNGPEQERLQQLAQPFGTRVRFVLDATDEERNAWYAASNLFVFLPRRVGTDVEGFGIVCLEAAAAGLPVLVSPSGGAAETVEPNVTGYVVDPSQREEILSRIRYLMEHPEEARAMGQAGKRRVARDFRWDDRWNSYKQVFYAG